ncbi:MAG: DUF389 domain-containing protein [Saccharofermentans sp.]|nr:DUF389 domain-containing protein [Saccharofermentans sp.]
MAANNKNIEEKNKDINGPGTLEQFRRYMRAGEKIPMKEVLKTMFSLSEDTASYEEIRDRLLTGGKVTGTNMVVMICAILIASVGLNTNSVAIIIGAMLISPLMGSILAMAYGTAVASTNVIERHSLGFLMQIVISVATSTLYFLLSPVKDVTTELMARTEPSMFSVIVAFFGGIAGIIGSTRKDKVTNVIPGVAIATAIMPPLCTCGYAIANAKWDMLINAAYLFTINAYFIFLSAELILLKLKVPKIKELSEKEKKVYMIRKIRSTVIILLPCIVFGVRAAWKIL